jgi:hypothetical protein
MEMTSHLTNTELEEFVSNPAKGWGTHLETCAECLKEVARLRETVQMLRPHAQRSEEFWQQQRWAIRARISGAAPPAAKLWPRAAWATALAMILAGTLILRTAPTPKAKEVQVDPDHELLLAVERAMQSQVPPSLEPAALLAREISDNTKIGPTSSSLDKEKNHEE